MTTEKSGKKYYAAAIGLLIIVISALHYTTPTTSWQFHLIYMQSYFIPIILAAFIFGIKGGLGSAVIISLIYLPHIMLQWGGLVENNLMRFLQIVLFNVLGYVTGLKAQGEKEEKEKYQRAAEKLEKSLQELQKKTEEIFDMEQQLSASERLSTIGELTASLAHEVRNPLGSIRGAVEIIRDAVPKEIKKLEFFDILIQDTKRLNEVVENYLSYARKQTHHIKSYDLIEIISNLNLMIGAKIRKSGIVLKTQFAEKTLPLKGDPNQLWQALMNVLLNAVQFMPQGGEINVSVEKTSDQNIKISIRDQGPGIEPEHLSQIFDSFYTTRKDGSGLGLAIVKRLAEQNNWKIEIDSKPGRGTEFVFYIPDTEA